MKSMTTRDFKVFLEPDEDYGGYVVVCPSLPGCYSQGKTVSEALANIREAIDLCLEDMESRGEEIPDPNNVLIGSVVVTRWAQNCPYFRVIIWFRLWKSLAVAIRQKGSHVRLRHSSETQRLPVTVPLHSEIAFGTLRRILRDASITVDELLSALW
jgi:antitoxin HicB